MDEKTKTSQRLKDVIHPLSWLFNKTNGEREWMSLQRCSSVWRRKATELFHIRFGPIQYETIYDVFQTLSELVKEAHCRDDEEQLKKLYDYAEWCSNQRAKDLWNAAGVSFYEHLVDDKITYQAIPYWIKPEIFWQIKGLLKWRIKDETAYQELVDNFNKVNGTNIEY